MPASMPSPVKAPFRIVPLVLAAVALAGCETTGSGPGSGAAAATPAPPPLTHSKAAEICWMATEKGRADMDLDKRIVVVDKCIDEKMKAVRAAPKS